MQYAKYVFKQGQLISGGFRKTV